MATLRLEDRSEIRDPSRIAKELDPLGVHLDRWPLGHDPGLLARLEREALVEEDKEAVLAALEPRFRELERTSGYRARDLIVVHPGLAGLDELLARFDRCHVHDDDEVRYVVDGAGVFGFVRPDGSQVALEVEREDYINVPAGTEHWFEMTAARRIKAVRYFVTGAGWVPRYTGTPIRMR